MVTDSFEVLLVFQGESHALTSDPLQAPLRAWAQLPHRPTVPSLWASAPRRPSSLARPWSFRTRPTSWPNRASAWTCTSRWATPSAPPTSSRASAAPAYLCAPGEPVGGRVPSYPVTFVICHIVCFVLSVCSSCGRQMLKGVPGSDSGESHQPSERRRSGSSFTKQCLT